MIHGFPLDYMHLVCLGVVKRLLLLWRGEKNCPRKSAAKRRKSRKDDKKGKDKQHQLTTADMANINNRIEVASQHFPKEFQRKGRSFDELEHWKAVEFRTFLLYSGPAVLKGILDEKKYQHFLLLHVAIRVLCTPNEPQNKLIMPSPASNLSSRCSEKSTAIIRSFTMYTLCYIWPMNADSMERWIHSARSLLKVTLVN